MSAYAAVISVRNTIHHILHSSRLSLVSPSLQIIKVAYKELKPWKEILQILDYSSKSKSRKKVNALDARIKDILWNFEDLLESLVSHQIILLSGEVEGDVLMLFSIDLQSLQDDVHSFIHTLEDMKEEYIYQLDNMPQDDYEDEDEDGSSISSSTSAGTFGEQLIERDEAEAEAEAEIERDVLLFSIDLQSLQDVVVSFIQTLKVMEKKYIYEVDNMSEDEDEDGSYIFSSTSVAGTFGGTTKSKMIGLSDQFEGIKRFLLDDDQFEDIKRFHALTGMAGVGKTRLAREIYEDPQIMTYFDFRLWITVGRKSNNQLDQDLRSILDELKGDEKCLIVLDDVWEREVLDSLLTSIKEMENRIIRILLTTRDGFVLFDINIKRTYPTVVRFLNEEESKDLLCLKVFGENIICPPQLDKAATKIANKCEGLPLTILTVADILSKSHNRDPKYWEDVAEERNSVFTDAYNQMSKVLYPSYDYLPQRFKMPFLYMAVFPRDYEIPLSKIINMLKAEGWFLDPHKQGHYSPEESIKFCLEDLCMILNLVLCKRKSRQLFHMYARRMIKTCRLHSAWRHLCRGEARKNKFYHVLNRLLDASEESVKGQRCLCLENNLLFGIKEFCNSVRLNCASSTRSLLFYGPYQQYPTPIDAIGFKLLRELDALQLRFYTFPMQILTLVQLKYLALTCNGDLPSTISNLFNLKVLIIHPHMSITKCCDTVPSSYIPIEIWDMIELEHIDILGKSFLAPPNDDDDVNVAANSLEKVSTLVGVNAASVCTIPKRTPNVRKLGVQVEVTPYDDVDYSSDLILSCFAHISILEDLDILKCSIINPVHGRSGSCWSWAPPRSLILPHGLIKLHLSGMGFPWEYMDAIGSLPSLQVLKLRSYAFRGPRWETQGDSFESLEYLLIEDSDLVEWKSASGSFRSLNYIRLKHCYKLKELQLPYEWYDDYPHGKIELVNCNPLAVTCAKKLRREGVQSVLVTASNDYEA